MAGVHIMKDFRRRNSESLGQAFNDVTRKVTATSRKQLQSYKWPDQLRRGPAGALRMITTGFTLLRDVERSYSLLTLTKKRLNGPSWIIIVSRTVA